MKSSKSIWFIVPCIVLTIFACVTINIYFPAEKVESVAGEIVDEIRGQKDGEGKQPPGSGENSLLRKTFYALSPSTAWAQQTQIINIFCDQSSIAE